MKANFPKLTLMAALSVAAVGTAYSHEDYSEGASLHWLSHVSETRSAPTVKQQAPFGYVATKNADREVTLANGSKYLNITRLETIKINVGGKTIIWTFDTLGTASFPLSKIVSGADDITVYVTENPAYQGG